MSVKNYYMDLLQKGRIEKILDYLEDNYGEWKLVIQKSESGKIRYYAQNAGDLPELDNTTEPPINQVLTEVKKHFILIKE